LIRTQVIAGHMDGEFAMYSRRYTIRSQKHACSKSAFGDGGTGLVGGRSPALGSLLLLRDDGAMFMHSRVVFDCHPFPLRTFPASLPTTCCNLIVPPRWFSLSDRLVVNSPLNAAPDTVRSVERHGAWWTDHRATRISLAFLGDERRSG
jgi:hypothetical protein